MSQRGLLVTLVLLLLFGAVFAAWPKIDLVVAAAFYSDGAFQSHRPALRALRQALHFLPVALLIAMIAAWVFARLLWYKGRPTRVAPTISGLVYVSLAMLLGPGLLANAILKEHSRRPRPVHIEQFGGPAAFRPWWSFDGACERNCSFVAGEVSAAFWLVAPASLAPPPLRTPAMAAAVAAGVVTALIRLAFGAHFLSDVLFAALITILICQGLYLFLIRRRPLTSGDG